MITEKMLEFLCLRGILRDGGGIAPSEFKILEPKYNKIKREFINEQLQTKK